MRWTLRVRGRRAARTTIEADAIVSGVGQLNRPNLPELPGRRARSPGPPSTRRVGTTTSTSRASGSWSSAPAPAPRSSCPEIAEPAAHLTILQRTPAWFLPTPDYRDDVEPEVAWLLQNVPGYTNWLRFWNFWQNVEGLMVAARVDPEWDNGGASVSQVNELIRQLFAQHLQAELAERPDLLPSVMPDYPPFSKRFIRDDGAWARTIMRDDVDLVTSPIAEITPGGRAHRGRHAARGRRPHLRHRVHRVRLPHADAHRRARRRGAARQVEGRRPRLPRHHAARATRTCSCSTGRTPTSS